MLKCIYVAGDEETGTIVEIYCIYYLLVTLHLKLLYRFLYSSQ